MSVLNTDIPEGKILHWFPELGYGWYPVTAFPYDETYFARYQERAHTPIGRALTQARIELVGRHWSGHVLDVGIGSGQFVESRPNTYGCDVNPCGQRWLDARELRRSLDDGWPAATFWDSLEHMNSPEWALTKVGIWAFVSLPIFKDANHVLRSKHYRKDEHHWYWTREGFMRWASKQGFATREVNDIESQLGREDILSFALERT